VGLYSGNTTIINFAEAKLTYNIDLITYVPTLSGFATVAANSDYEDAPPSSMSSSSFESYFCDPATLLPTTNTSNDVTTQGEMLFLCFKVPEGQFNIKDILDLTIMDALSSTSQEIFADNGTITTSTPYAEKTCTDSSSTDMNICVVKILLRADFYTYEAVTLTGTGAALLELGGRRQKRNLLQDHHRGSALKSRLLQNARRLQPDTIGSRTTTQQFAVQPMTLRTVAYNRNAACSAANDLLMSSCARTLASFLMAAYTLIYFQGVLY
jgi:hypothetical protein